MNRRRLLFLTLFLGACYAALSYRLIELQLFRHTELRALALDNTQRSIFTEPPRGDIRDIRGNILATSVRVKTICADPGLLGNYSTDLARLLAPHLQMPEAALLSLLLKTTGTNVLQQVIPNHYVRLKTKVPEQDWAIIQEALAKQCKAIVETRLIANRPLTSKERIKLQGAFRRGIFAEDDQLRIYPSQALAAHVLGFTTPDERVTNGYRLTLNTGREGVEATFNDKLSGARGWRLTETDSRRRELVAFREQDLEARPGLDVVLTLDARVQQIAEEELLAAMQKHTPISASAVVVRPATGEILAMATYPNFDPNSLSASSMDARRNRVVSDMAEPGSTFKIVVVAGALNERLITLTDTFDCEHGTFYFAGRPLRDHESYGVLTVENIITKSSNIGAAKIGIRMGEALLYQYVRSFGFGSKTGVELLGEASGIVHPLKNWKKISISRIPMGHEMTATPLQMIMAMCAIANGGTLMRAMLVDRLEDEHGQVITKYRPQTIRRVVSEGAAKEMVAALKTVVSPEGTGPKAMLDHYAVAGKTGTAQKPPYTGKHYSSFIGFLPADAPELCISVVMDEPKGGYYGGQVAAPVFKRIAERAASYLNIRPDILEPPQTMVRFEENSWADTRTMKGKRF